LEPSEVTPDSVATLAKAALENPAPAIGVIRQEIAAMPHPIEVLHDLVSTFG
jgi:hypothetical protein